MPKTSCTCEKCNVKRNSGVKNWEEYVRRLSVHSAVQARSQFYDMLQRAIRNRQNTGPPMERIFEYNPEPLVASDLEVPPPVMPDIPVTRVVTPYGTINNGHHVDVYASPCEDESEPQGG